MATNLHIPKKIQKKCKHRVFASCKTNTKKEQKKNNRPVTRNPNYKKNANRGALKPDIILKNSFGADVCKATMNDVRPVYLCVHRTTMNL